jgi:hypothetical protein
MSETFAPLIFGALATRFNATLFPRVYGYLVFGAVCLGYGFSNIFYYKAGRQYEKLMK